MNNDTHGRYYFFPKYYYNFLHKIKKLYQYIHIHLIKNVQNIC